MRLLVPLLVACERNPDTGDSSVPHTLPERFQIEADKEGLSVGYGSFGPVSAAFCCEAVVDCLAIDPADHLGVVALPKAPEQEEIDFDEFWMWGPVGEDLTRSYRLRPDEAIVWTGPPPPEAAYAAFLPQVSARAAVDESRYRVQGALGPPLSLASDAERITVIVAPDRAVDDRIRKLLFSSGFEPQTVYSAPFSTSLARLGLEPLADTFVSMVQVLDPVDPTALDAWFADPSIDVMRVTPETPAAAPEIPWPYQPIAARGTDTDESSLEGALDLLGLALYQHFQAPLSAPGEVSARWRDPVACLSNLDCDDSWPTRLRYESETFTLESSTVMLVYGVNHTKTGKSAASSVSMVSLRSDTGTALFDHKQLAGSASQILPAHPDIDKLYSVVFARDCAPIVGLPCVDVPETCPGPGPDREMFLQFDDWLEPATGAAPHEEELLVPRAVKLLSLF